jgi:hypothetical protein
LCLRKKIIGFRDVKYPHTGFAIEEEINKCLFEWVSTWQHVAFFTKMERLIYCLVVSIFLLGVMPIYLT